MARQESPGPLDSASRAVGRGGLEPPTSAVHLTLALCRHALELHRGRARRAVLSGVFKLDG